MTDTDQVWMTKAACRGADIAVFIDNDEGPLREDWSDAAAICSVCAVTDECLADAISNREVWAYRAGVAPLDMAEEIDRDYEPAARDESHLRRLRRRKLQRMRECSQISPSPSRHIRRTG